MKHYTCGEILIATACSCITLIGCVALDTVKTDAVALPIPSATAAMTTLDTKPLELPDEDARINDALLQQGYLREDVPLSYDLQAILHAECEYYDIPYSLALGLIEVESCFKSSAVSSNGDYGLCQLNPQYFPTGLSDLENIQYGLEYLSECMDTYGSTAAALTAYHAGEDTGNRTYANMVLQAAQRWEAK